MARNPFRSSHTNDPHPTLDQSRLPAICLCAGMIAGALLPLGAGPDVSDTPTPTMTQQVTDDAPRDAIRASDPQGAESR